MPPGHRRDLRLAGSTSARRSWHIRTGTWAGQPGGCSQSPVRPRSRTQTGGHQVVGAAPSPSSSAARSMLTATRPTAASSSWSTSMQFSQSPTIRSSPNSSSWSATPCGPSKGQCRTGDSRARYNGQPRSKGLTRGRVLGGPTRYQSSGSAPYPRISPKAVAILPPAVRQCRPRRCKAVQLTQMPSGESRRARRRPAALTGVDQDTSATWHPKSVASACTSVAPMPRCR